jgi:hypothetical protein
MKNILLILILFACTASCTVRQQLDAPVVLRARALGFAKQYAAADTIYLWGGQDPLRVIRIDCSGLVVMCYKYALADTGYALQFSDATAGDMHDYYSRETDNPLPGDLVFMGSADETAVSHIALFKEKKGGRIYFIDSTEKDAEGEYPAVNGVSERNYPEDDPRFKSFGIMQINKNR